MARQRRLDLAAIDAMLGRRREPVHALRHAALQLNHPPRREPLRLHHPATRVALFVLQPDQLGRGQNPRKRVLEFARVRVDHPMQRPRDVVPVEHAPLARDQRQNLLGLLPDQLCIAVRRARIQPPPLDLTAFALNPGRMNSLVFGRLKLQSAIGMGPVVKALLKPGAA